jgi:chromosome segregation ATPase
MAKLSQLFVRTPLSGTDEVRNGEPEAAPDTDGSAGFDTEASPEFDASQVESGPEISARIGEACEALRNLIVEAGSKVNELEDTKQAFFELVDPADQALRILEQEKTRNISLTRRLEQLRTVHEVLQVKYDDAEKRLDAEAKQKEQLRLELEQEQRTVRELKGIRAELTNDIEVVRAMSANVEHQVGDLTARVKTLGEDNQRHRSHAIEAETKVSGLESALAAERETLAIVQGENQSLQAALTQAVADSSNRGQRVSELETALATATARTQQLEATLFGVETDRNKLLTEVNELSERERNAHNKLHAQFEALQARAAMAEKLLGNTRQLLGARSEEARASDRNVAEAKRARDAAETRLREIEALVKSHENQIRELERARAALTDRNASLASSLKTREAQLADLEEQKLRAADQIARLENEMKAARMASEKRIDGLVSLLDHERLERQVVEGALDATRSERAQLQHELYRMRRAIRDGRAPEETSEPAPRQEQDSDRSADAA